MLLVFLMDEKAMCIETSPFVYTQPKDNGLYSLEALYIHIDEANPDTLLLLPDGTEIAEGDEITASLRESAMPFSVFVRATREQAQADALGLMLRTPIAAGTITDDELYRIAPAFVDREWRAGLFVEIGDVYAHGEHVWRCVSAHTTEANWKPSLVPALWRRVGPAEPGELRVWQFLTDYLVDDVVHYPDEHSPAYRCVTAHTSQDGWEPPNVPALWAVYVPPTK